MSTTILVTGSNGMLGKSLQKIMLLHENKNFEFIFLTRKELDLSDSVTVLDYPFKKIDIVIHLAAKCGGLYDNMTANFDFYTQNSLINQNVILLCQKYNVKKLFNILSTCIFPENPPALPLISKYILDGPPHPSNEGYSYSKRNLLIHSKLLTQSQEIQIINLIPTNLYGIHDTSSHVIPQLIKRAKYAKDTDTDFIIKGDGYAKRQFLFVDDLSTILYKLLFKEFTKVETCIIIAPPIEHTIIELANKISSIINLNKNPMCDKYNSNGQVQKTADSTELNNYLQDFTFTSLDDGLKQIIEIKDKIKDCS
jgi:GDP-L-fucose synthase